MRRWLGFILVGLLAPLLATCSAPAATPAGRDLQTAWGGAVYRTECARCHDPGRGAPELTAERLVRHGNAANLFEYNRQWMPLNEPGALPERDYWDVTAYILAEAGMLNLPPQTVLGPETAERVNFLPR